MSFQNAFLGSLIGDAVSMPVHWYYNTNALDKDYGNFEHYEYPKSPHPDSILWRSTYTSKGEKDNILENQIKYWGIKGIHYHQLLRAGENTLNLKLACELYKTIIKNGEFNLNDWLTRYAEVMTTPGWHNDTYVEEYHRSFFNNYQSGKNLSSCGISDFHIGGLSLIPALLAGLEALDIEDELYLNKSVHELVNSTHKNANTLKAAKDFCTILIKLKEKPEIRSTLTSLRLSEIPLKKIKIWENWSDRKVVGATISPACYLPESFTAALYFVWKYSDDFSLGVLANAKAGGDNCHRGVVVGAMIAMQTGIPPKWMNGLKCLNDLSCEIIS